ncbi:MAG: hypothetical protein M1825_006405 [Sarcosagium campestre]|nr:MAG: hypothetical protein M1825_006405 [Sarcosagium campestre]
MPFRPKLGLRGIQTTKLRPSLRNRARFLAAHRCCREASQQSGGAGGSQDYQLQPGSAQPTPDTQQWGSREESESASGGNGNGNGNGSWKPTLFKMFESAATTLASLAMLGLAGYSYHKLYKYMVLQKMDDAFAPGSEPVLELAGVSMKAPSTVTSEDEQSTLHWISREEQSKIDAIIDGTDHGHYHLLLGEKGVGKSSMLLDAIQKVDGEGIAMFDAHADLEIVRIRLGKALNFEFNEDNIGGLFSIRGPRDTTALLDIERAFNKLEKVALKRRNRVGRPLILIINSLHLIRDDEDGKDLLELLQQRAEQWAASNLVTVVLNSDDYWPYERLKQYATRMQVMPVLDLKKTESLQALRNYRLRYFNEDVSQTTLERVYDKVGGRLTFLNRVAKSTDMTKTCDEVCEVEKTWFLNQVWIFGDGVDDDVMDQQKFASAAMVLAKALVDKEKEMEHTFDPNRGHILPQIPLHEAREIMTRADFIKAYDHINIFTIDSKAMVRADSVPMMNAFREVCSQPGFDGHLQATLDRISAIESLGRTREIVAKDLWDDGKYRITLKNAKGVLDKEVSFEVVPGKRDDDG